MSELVTSIAAVIVQYGHWLSTERCLESLLVSTFPPKWIVIVDNCSPDSAHEEARTWIRRRGKIHHNFTEIHLIHLNRNGGYATGNNAGIRLGLDFGADAILLLNNDTYVHHDALGAMIKRFASAKRPGLCGPVIAYPGDQPVVQCCGGGRTDYFSGLSSFFGSGLPVSQALGLSASVVEPSINFICGACVLVSRDFIETVGLMDEGYFLYCEEQDWALRNKGRFELLFAPGALVYHHEGLSTGWNARKFSWKMAAMLARSRLRLAWRHHPHFLPSVFVCCSFAFMGKLVGKCILKGKFCLSLLMGDKNSDAER